MSCFAFLPFFALAPAPASGLRFSSSIEFEFAAPPFGFLAPFAVSSSLLLPTAPVPVPGSATDAVVTTAAVVSLAAGVPAVVCVCVCVCAAGPGEAALAVAVSGAVGVELADTCDVTTGVAIGCSTGRPSGFSTTSVVAAAGVFVATTVVVVVVVVSVLVVVEVSVVVVVAVVVVVSVVVVVVSVTVVVVNTSQNPYAPAPANTLPHSHAKTSLQGVVAAVVVVVVVVVTAVVVGVRISYCAFAPQNLCQFRFWQLVRSVPENVDGNIFRVGILLD